MVYVGTMRWPYGRMVMFHMATDSEDLGELHLMADKIGVNRKWFQNKGTNSVSPHYDICLAKKKLALELGAQELSDREIIKRCFPKLYNL